MISFTKFKAVFFVAIFAMLLTPITTFAQPYNYRATEMVQTIEGLLPIQTMQTLGTWDSYQSLKEEFLQASNSYTTSAEFALLTRYFAARLAHYWVSDFSSYSQTIVSTVEQAHPVFIVEDIANEYNFYGLPVLPANYQQLRDDYLYFTTGYISRAQFAFATQRYLTLLQDGHMSGNFLFDELTGGPFITGGFIDIDWHYRNGGLYLNDGTKIIKIGGVPVSYVLQQVRLHYFAENDVARNRIYSIKSKYIPMTYKAGGASTGTNIYLTTESTVLTADITKNFPPGLFNRPPVDQIITFSMIDDDIFYIDLRAFIDGPHIDDAVAAIQEAVADGVTQYIIDLRYNPGGNSFVGARLLDAMGATNPSFGVVRRASDLLINHFEMLLASEFVHYEEMEAILLTTVRNLRMALDNQGYIIGMPSVEDAVNLNNVYVVVLTNTDTFSSATMTGAWVQDGNLGSIIGTPSRNAVASFGEMMPIDMQGSFFNISTSTTMWLRPNQNAVPDILVPDVFAEVDALETAISFLRDMER